eukprot:TRINITY_DN62315_c0_g1_i1.p1 TRINITY_DN62315_c0_g1~~TRINITY_DN62315_c0_g1_i1.p1  ORF type:complete len:100 (+),score=1.10 TRINITY_DN62315_c0_g1_i1:134-433(+)
MVCKSMRIGHGDVQNFTRVSLYPLKSVPWLTCGGRLLYIHCQPLHLQILNKEFHSDQNVFTFGFKCCHPKLKSEHMRCHDDDNYPSNSGYHFPFEWGHL